MKHLSTFMLLLGAATQLLSDQPDHAEIVASQQQAQHVAAWRRYSFSGIPKVAPAPVIDGVVDTREWTAAAAIGYSLHMAEGMQVQDRAVWRLCYTDSHLYVAWEFERPESARTPGPRDFAELLLDVGHAHGRYHNIAFNLEKELWSGIGPNVDRTAWTPQSQFRARQTANGWEGEWAVAFSEFSGLTQAPAPGTIWGLDLVRNERTPTDRLAHWAWRSVWHASKDLAHIMFTGEPLAVRVEDVGWLPAQQKMGVKIAISNFSDVAVKLAAALELRQARQPLAMPFIPALDSAFTEDLSAAIGVQMDEEITRLLQPFEVITESHETVEIPPQSSKLLAATLPDRPGNYLAGFKIDRDGQMLTAMNVPFIVSVPLNITLSSYLYSAGILAYTIDLRRVQDRITPETVLQVTARLGKDGEVVAQTTHQNIAGQERIEAELHFAPASGATYYVTGELLRDGHQLGSNSAPLVLPKKPVWLGSDVGRSKFVPRPWQPLVADAAHVETLMVGYRWPGHSIFPEVRVKDREIFAEPWRLTFQDDQGTAVPLVVTDFNFDSGDIETATYSFAATVGDLGALAGTVTVAFDGFLWYDVVLTPAAPVTLAGCIFSATLKPEFARIYTRGRILEGEGDQPIPGPDCGRIPPSGLSIPYTFQTWVGDVEGGLQWYCENARNWHNEDDKAAVRIRPAAAGTTLEVRYVDKPTTIEAPIDWHFGLMPTPAKKCVDGIEDNAHLQLGGLPDVTPPDPALAHEDPRQYRERMAQQEMMQGGWKANGVRRVILFAPYGDLFGYPGFKDKSRGARLHAFVALMHSQDIKVLVYNGWGISTECDEWPEFGSELVNLPLKNSGYSTYWGSPLSLYNDLFVYRVAEHMREFNLDGIYTDSTLGVNYSEHPNGARWTDGKGRTRGSYPVRAMRGFAMRIYKVLNGEVVQDGVFFNHHSPPANVCIENFTSVRHPSEYAQFYDGELDQAFIDYFLAKNGGIQFGYHTELTNKNWMQTIKKQLNELNAIAVPLGVSFKAINFVPYIGRAYGRTDQPMHNIWRAFAWLDSKKAEHYPWWSDAHLITVTPTDGTLSAVWLRPGQKALICVSNLRNEGRSVSAVLDLAAMGFAAVQLDDAITGEALALQGKAVTVAVEPQRWRLLRVQPRQP